MSVSRIVHRRPRNTAYPLACRIAVAVISTRLMRNPAIHLVGFTALLLLLLLVPLRRVLGDSYAMTALLDIMHAPVFAVFAMLSFRSVRPWFAGRIPAAIAVWTVVVALGGIVEFTQGFTGRGPTWTDALANAGGATAGLLLLFVLFDSRWSVRWLLLGTAIGLLSLCSIGPLRVLTQAYHSWRALPLLASFEQPHELEQWESGNCAMSRQNRHATLGQWALRADYQPAGYSRVGLRYFPGDWTGYRTMACDVTLAAGPPVELTIKVQDRWHTGEYEDRFHQTFVLQPGTQTLRIDLDEVAAAPQGRSMDMQTLRWVEWFTVNLDHPCTLYFDNVRLE